MSVVTAAKPPEPHFAKRLFVGLLVIDLLVIAAHVIPALFTLAGVPVDRPRILELGRDWALGEVINYVTWATLVVVLIHACIRYRQLLFAALAAVFLYALADDSLQLHKRNSLFLPQSMINWGLPYYLQEILFWGIVGLIVLVPLAYGWLIASNGARRAVIPLFGCFLGVAFCAVVFDLIHSLAWIYEPEDRRILGRLSSVAEDGGEMIFLSAALACAVGTFGWPTAFGLAASHRQGGGPEHRAQGE